LARGIDGRHPGLAHGLGLSGVLIVAGGVTFNALSQLANCLLVAHDSLFGAEKYPGSGSSGNAIQRLENTSRIMPRPAQRREIFSVSLIISLFSGNSV
jgi:hypothetical protein